MKRLAPILIVLGAGCGAGVTPPEIDSRPDDAATKPVGSIGRDGGKGGGCAPGVSDLPPAIEATLMTRCWSCHGSPPAGAPMALVTLDDLVAPARSDPGKTNARVSLARMEDVGRPMPPGAGPTVPPSEIAAFRAWVEAGLPRRNCDHPADLGVPPESRRDMAMPPHDVLDMAVPPPPHDVLDMAMQSKPDMAMQYKPDMAIQSKPDMAILYKPDMAMGGNPPDLGMVGSVCTSNVRWTKGSQSSPQMRPGNACIACHKSNNRAPQFTIAGTIYPTLHEPTDCNGLDGTRSGVQVVITDKAGKVITLQPNSAGNFYSMSAIALPFRASIVSGNKKRDMVSAQSSGDCNSCHTENGTAGAPGRVMTP